MKRIILISCVSKKREHKTKAKYLYHSTLFKYALKYAQKLTPDKIYILSALYGLVELDEEINPYNKTLNKMKKIEKQEWSNKVLNQLKQKNIDLINDEFIILAGKNYREYLVDEIKNYKIPMEGLGIGEQLSFLKRNTI